MTRNQFSDFISQGNRINNPATAPVLKTSVTDPSYFQTGRQMLTNPLPIQPRVSYFQGAPLNKQDVLNMKEYDKMYPDRFKASMQAQVDIETTKEGLKKMQDKAFGKQQQPQQQQQQQN